MYVYGILCCEKKEIDLFFRERKRERNAKIFKDNGITRWKITRVTIIQRKRTESRTGNRWDKGIQKK